MFAPAQGRSNAEDAENFAEVAEKNDCLGVLCENLCALCV
jgi:hypothetical protein